MGLRWERGNMSQVKSETINEMERFEELEAEF